MPKSIDLMPEHRAQLGRNMHNLSHDFSFTATTGHLLPVFHDVLNPGERVDVGLSFELRTQPLQSAAMADIDVHTEFFFVPMMLLYSPFESYFYGVNDQYSSSFHRANINDGLPVLDFSALKTSLESNTSLMSVYGDNLLGSCYRLFEHLGYANTQTSPVPAFNFFPAALLAYNCIYEYYYRLDTRETFNNSFFNWDNYYNSSLVQLDSVAFASICSLKHRPLYDDYFTSVKVSPIVDVLNLVGQDLGFDLANNWLSRSSINDGFNAGDVLSQGTIGSDSSAPASSVPSDEITTNFGFGSVSSSSPYSNGLDINTANIRAMFANEKLWSVTGRAKKHYDDQTLAHFGIKVPHDVKHQISCFGHDITPIKIGEVISTASTDAAPLGEIAGKGYSYQNSNIHKFTAPVHGIVMAIMSIVPKVSYRETFLKVNQLTDRNSFYHPEYDHLGMQPLFAYEANGGDDTSIYGWQYRYEQFKRRYNRVTSAFNTRGSLNSWKVSMKPYYGVYQYNEANEASFADFLCSSTMLNEVMLVSYDPAFVPYGSTTVGDVEVANRYLMYDKDPFVISSHITCKKYSSMSDYSLPKLID